MSAPRVSEADFQTGDTVILTGYPDNYKGSLDRFVGRTATVVGIVHKGKLQGCLHLDFRHGRGVRGASRFVLHKSWVEPAQ